MQTISSCYFLDPRNIPRAQGHWRRNALGCGTSTAAGREMMENPKPICFWCEHKGQCLWRHQCVRTILTVKILFLISIKNTLFQLKSIPCCPITHHPCPCQKFFSSFHAYVFFSSFWEDSLGESREEAETGKSLEKIPSTQITLLKDKQIFKCNIYKQRVKCLELHMVSSPRGAEGSSLRSEDPSLFHRCFSKGLVMMGCYLQHSSCHINPMVGLHCLFVKCFFVKCLTSRVRKDVNKWQ